AFDTPVISGNVSFSNETEGRAIAPTPVIAMVGILSDVTCHLKQHFSFPDDLIIRVRTAPPSLVGSEYAALFGGDFGELAPVNLARERRLLEGLVECAQQRLIRSAHDVAEGGLAVAIAEACFNPDRLTGAQLELGEIPPHELFGEGPSTVVLSAAPGNLQAIREVFSSLEVSAIGRVIAHAVIETGGAFNDETGELKRLYDEALPQRIGA
ncbi:MAG: AIR synthase-related protein, partial [Candidatus Binataceae bacterium]